MKLLFVTPYINAFIRNDLEILEDQYQVHVNTYDWTRKILTPFCKISYINATMLLPVSSPLVKTYNTYNSNNKLSNQGYQSFFKNIDTPFKVRLVIHS